MITEPSSFRDPSGHLYWHEGNIYRSITDKYIKTYNSVKESGLYDELIAEKSMVAFQEQSKNNKIAFADEVSLVIKPEVLPFISYPYEWSFSQLKDAALLTLDLHIRALKRNFLLKDASAYNVQFLNGKPTFIDHLSFEECENYPVWPAYGQFCRHFLAPLVLMSKVDPGLNSLLKVHIDGIPLPMACKLIPTRKLLSLGLFVHFLLHAKSQQKHSDSQKNITNTAGLSSKQMVNLAISLRDTIAKLKWKAEGTEWGEYYSDTNYSSEAMESKFQIVKSFAKKVPDVKMIWDLGGNTGEFSREVQDYAELVVCFDVDMVAVENNYLQVKGNNDKKILPLVMDLTNPSSAIGFASKERGSLTSRGKSNLAIALAIVHHLAISNNIPLKYIAEYLSSITDYLIIEFIPKEDSQVQRLLKSRHDIFTRYTEEDFVADFSHYFNIFERKNISDSCRTIFFMKRSC